MHRNSFFDSNQINELQDDIFRNQVIKLHEVVERQNDMKDLLLCRRWVCFLAQANYSENYIRNYLLTLIYDQLTSNGNLDKPFTDVSNLDENRSLGGIMASLCNNFEKDKRERRQNEQDKVILEFGKCCELKEFAKKSNSSGSSSYQSSGKTLRSDNRLSVNCCERQQDPSCRLSSHLKGRVQHDERPMTSGYCGHMRLSGGDCGDGIVSLRQYNLDKVFNTVSHMKTEYDLLQNEFNVLEQQITKMYRGTQCKSIKLPRIGDQLTRSSKVPVSNKNRQEQSWSPKFDDIDACGCTNRRK